MTRQFCPRVQFSIQKVRYAHFPENLHFIGNLRKHIAHLFGSNSQFCCNRSRNGTVTTILSYSILNLLDRKKLTVLLAICVHVTVAISSKSPHGGHLDRLECFGKNPNQIFEILRQNRFIWPQYISIYRRSRVMDPQCTSKS